MEGDFKLILKNDNDDIKEISLPMVLLIDNSLETLIENSETECNSSSCNNESQNFCDCGSEYEDFEIYDIRFPDLQADKAELLEILMQLCDLKYIKDLDGKTPYYLEQQPLAWTKAKSIIQKHKQ